MYGKRDNENHMGAKRIDVMVFNSKGKILNLKAFMLVQLGINN